MPFSHPLDSITALKGLEVLTLTSEIMPGPCLFLSLKRRDVMLFTLADR